MFSSGRAGSDTWKQSQLQSCQAASRVWPQCHNTEEKDKVHFVSQTYYLCDTKTAPNVKRARCSLKLSLFFQLSTEKSPERAHGKKREKEIDFPF